VGSSARSRRVSKQAQFVELAGARGFARIGDAEMTELGAALAPISEGTLRKAARASGLALDPLVEGVVQDSFEALERTLCALEQVYTGSDPERSKRARREVLKAREHAGFSLRRLEPDSERAAFKSEVLLWLRTWLGNPPLFPAWAAIRKRVLEADRPE
jgi:hypothetical protein